jgi:pyruvate/2-oxoglutarate dehydrogenase complex dihydrolipoamide acyltransferase (E2) component
MVIFSYRCHCTELLKRSSGKAVDQDLRLRSKIVGTGGDGVKRTISTVRSDFFVFGSISRERTVFFFFFFGFGFGKYHTSVFYDTTMLPTAVRFARRPSIQFLGKEGWAAKLSPPITVPIAGTAALATPPTTVAMASSSSVIPTPPTQAATTAAAAAATSVVSETVTTVPPSLYSDTPASNMRKVISRRLTESKSTVPHFYTSIEVPLDNILQLRKVFDKEFDTKVSVNDFIIKASAMALRDVPELNATYDTKSQSQRTFDNVDISVAVATPTGLITPIIPSTASLSLTDISTKVKDLASRARDNKLTPEEYQGGTFCISNLGMFGISEFSAVINPPQGAILAVGGGERKIVPGKVNLESGTKERPGIQTIMTARLSADRRVVDEATASLFMGVLKEYLSQPKLMML